MNRQANFPANRDSPEIAGERVERLNDRSTGTVLDRHQAKIDVPPGDLFKHTFQRSQVFVVDTFTKVLGRSQVAERTERTEVADARWPSQLKRPAQDLMIDTFQCGIGNGAPVLLSDLPEDHRFKLVIGDQGVCRVQVPLQQINGQLRASID